MFDLLVFACHVFNTKNEHFFGILAKDSKDNSETASQVVPRTPLPLTTAPGQPQTRKYQQYKGTIESTYAQQSNILTPICRDPRSLVFWGETAPPFSITSFFNSPPSSPLQNVTPT